MKLIYRAETILNPKERAAFNGYFGREKALDESYSNRSKGMGLEYYNNFYGNFALGSNITFNIKNYDQKEALYSSFRKDDLFAFSLSLTYFSSLLELESKITARYKQNRSSIPVYTYERNQLQYNMVKKF